MQQAGSAHDVLAQELGTGRRSADRAAEPVDQPSLLDELDGRSTAPALDLAAALVQAAQDIRSWSSAGIGLVTILDADYPSNLRAVHDRPPLLFVRGRIAAADSRAVAVIGSRRASPVGLERAALIAGHLVSTGHTVVSGLAAGIDAAAHVTALEAGGRTLAVIGTGLTRCYPAGHEALQRQIAERCAVVSQFWPETPPGRHTFPMRNATMSGLSLATVVVEASNRSGARVQVRRALAHGRPVFLAEPLLSQAWGQEVAAKPGVQVFDSPEQITAGIERLHSAAALSG